MPVLAWLAIGALGGAWLRSEGDGVIDGSNNSTGIPSVAMLGLAAFGAYALWQKVK